MLGTYGSVLPPLLPRRRPTLILRDQPRTRRMSGWPREVVWEHCYFRWLEVCGNSELRAVP